MSILYRVDCVELTCTCPAGRYNGEKRLCRHVRACTSRGGYRGVDLPEFSVWKEKGKDRWYAASRWDGLVASDLPSLLNTLNTALNDLKFKIA